MFTNILKTRASETGQSFLLKKVADYLSPLCILLDGQLDRRLVDTFSNLFLSILMHRNRSMGLLLSELGGFILGDDRAPAGTKRISNLLRSSKWGHELIDKYFFSRGKDRIAEMYSSGIRPLLLWDDSIVEKPESWVLEGLCSVPSSKAGRLTKLKRGFYRLTSRICVPGYHWSAVMLSSLNGVPSVMHMAWWTTKGKFKDWGSNVIFRMLRRIDSEIGRVALHVFDRGYANATMIEWLCEFKQDFLIRWKSNILLADGLGAEKPTHLLARSFVSSKAKWVVDKQRKSLKKVCVAWGQVFHPEFPKETLCLVVVRDMTFKGTPMYLLTNTPVETSMDAWKLCFAYFHRWNIEQAFRFSKSELGIEAPRLWFWENRLKMMAIVALVFDFLMQMLRNWNGWVRLFIQQWAKRTGEKCKNAKVPLYRLRAAISKYLYAEWHKYLYQQQHLDITTKVTPKQSLG